MNYNEAKKHELAPRTYKNNWHYAERFQKFCVDHGAMRKVDGLRGLSDTTKGVVIANDDEVNRILMAH